MTYKINLQKTMTILVFIVLATLNASAQQTGRTQPVWWFGQSVAANFNSYRGTTQMLNETLTVPTAFHKGEGVRPYFSLLTEYRPNKMWGGMLNIAFDNRGGKFDGVIATCDCPADLKTNLSYIAIEPSLRLAPFKSSFYLFAGPTYGINISKEFEYTQEKQEDRRGDFSNIRKTKLNFQGGAGLDLPISAPTSLTQTTLSPFVSFQSNIGSDPREDQSWSVYTIRAGIALKFGTVRNKQTAEVKTIESPIAATAKGVQFSVRAPKVLPAGRRVKETFPLRNSVFFNEGSSAIPSRYTTLTPSQASAFSEHGLQEGQPTNAGAGRSARQMNIYHHIMNIMGDRLRANPGSSILLAGSSAGNPAEGKQMAENIKQYITTTFGINPSRITTEGRDKPVVPSEQPGATKELTLLHEGDRRVDITSTSNEMLLQVGGSTSAFLRPVQITAIQTDPLDTHVIFTNTGAAENLKNWGVSLTDERGAVQRFGPYTKDQASVQGSTILGANDNGNYKVVMTGETKTGSSVSQESFVSVQKLKSNQQEGLRYSILFDFDASKTLNSYEKFLTDIVAPLIKTNSTVIIHGYTDVIGEEYYNHKLSQERATGTQQILSRKLSALGVQGVKYETFGFGEDETMAPFENDLPEKRFYNRTVIIDIIPAN